MHESTGRQDEREGYDIPEQQLSGDERAILGPAEALTIEHFRAILGQADHRCFFGKGVERHSNSPEGFAPFNQHDFWPLLEAHGTGFATGQIDKKLREFIRTGDAKQLLDIIVYTTALICWEDAGHAYR
jgi:hypothetical protein